MGPRSQSRALPALFAAAFTASCVTYEAAPLDSSEAWSALEGLRLPASVEEQDSGFLPVGLAAFAVANHPTLVQARSEIGVSEALIIEAGLWPGLQVGWGAMDALASQIVDSHTSSVDYLSGLDLMFELPRPGERDAKKEGATWRAAAARARLFEAEWLLARDVLFACAELSTTERLLAAMAEMSAVTDKTSKYFVDAAEVGAANATEASLAMGDALAIRVDMKELEVRAQTARRALNGFLGLRPDYHIELASLDRWSQRDFERPIEELEADALGMRPELIAARALYEASEADLRLEIARQFPLLAVGTGISIRPGFFSRFNRPAIDTAMRRREVADREFKSLLFSIRTEIFDSVQLFRAAVSLREMIEGELMVNAENSLDAVNESLELGEVALVETLNVQRALIAARTRLEEARARELIAAMRLATVTGRLAALESNNTNN